MKKIRIGNDIHFKWMITREGLVESFDGKQVDVELRDQTGRRWPVKWSINADDGCVDGVFYGHMQQAAGTYSLTLTENRGGKEMATVDRTAAWQLVARQDNACEGTDEGALGVTVEQMESEINVGKAEGVTLERVAQGVRGGEWLNLRNDGYRSCTGGFSSSAKGSGSFSFGGAARAIHDYSACFGLFITTTSRASFACGRFNYETSNAIYTIGVGHNNNSRLNSEVTIATNDDKNGYKYLLGVGGYKGQDIEDGMKSLQEVVVDLDRKTAQAKKTKRKKRYVIGRAIKPWSCEDAGHENIYCYGNGGRAFHLHIKEGYSLRLFIDDVEYIKSDTNSGTNTYVIYPRLSVDDKTRLVRVGKEIFSCVLGYSVDSYEENDNVLLLRLKSHEPPLTLSSESTHHSFVQGRRKYVGSFLQKNIFVIGYSSLYVGCMCHVSDCDIADECLMVYKHTKRATVYGYKRRYSRLRNKISVDGRRQWGGSFRIVERHRFFEKRKTKAVYIDLRRMFYKGKGLNVALRKMERE